MLRPDPKDLIARLERMRRSPGVTLDRLDHAALTWAIALGQREVAGTTSTDTQPQGGQ